MHTLITSITAATMTAGAAAMPVIENGGLNGGIAQGFAPPEWEIGQATPDVAGPTGPFNNTGVPWALSPEGGTFARLNGVGNFQSESIAQSVSGFDIGASYTLSFYVTNLGFRVNSTGAWTGFDGVIEIYADGNLLGTSDVYSKQNNATDPIQWTLDSVEFVAPSETFTLEIRGETVAGELNIAYMGVDGIGVQPVPAPGVLAMLTLSGLAASRRRR